MFARAAVLPAVLTTIAFCAIVAADLSVAHAQQYASEERSQRDREDAIDQFTRRFVWSNQTTSQTLVIIDSIPISGTTTETTFYQGRHGRELSKGELYDVIGHPELAEEFRTRRRRGHLLLWGGGIGSIGFGLAALGAAIYEEDQEDRGYPLTIGLTIFAGISAIAMIPGYYYDQNRDPLEPHQRNELIEEYNLQLLDDLGLRREDLPRNDDRDRPSSDGLRVDGYFTDDGGGITLGFTF